MKNKSMVFFILLVLAFSVFLVGCGNKEVTVEKDTKTTQDTTPTQEQTISFAQISLENSIKENVEDKLLGKRVILSSNFKKGNVGDYGAFGLGINNLLNRPATFKVYMDFASATKTLVGGEETITATADEDLMNSWMNYGKTIALNKNEQTVIPIKYIIGNKLNSNEELPAGRYKFTIEVYEIEENGHEQMYQMGNLFIDFLVVE